MFSTDQITKDTIAYISNHLSRLLQDAFIGGADIIPTLPTADNWQVAIHQLSPVREQVETICNAANGNTVDVYYLNECIQGVCELLFVAPAGANSYNIPSSFWASDLGQAIMYARVNVSGDELLTLTDAARLLSPDEDIQTVRMRIKRAIDSGELNAYIDSNEANPQKHTRVSRSEIENLGDSPQAPR